MNLPERIRTFRLAKGYTQEYMASTLGMTIGNYSNMELGKTKISLEWLAKIAGIYGYTASKLLDETTEFNEKALVYDQPDNLQLQQLSKVVFEMRRELDALRKEVKLLHNHG